MPRPGQPDPAERPATYGDVFAVAEFRWLWAALVGSVIGDQLARVALAVLVFDRTGSAGLSALAYALTLLPDIVSGPLLSGLADRFPRRRVVVSCDVARAVLVAGMAIPGAPLWILCVLLIAVQLLAAPFQSARTALMATIMTGDKYKAATGVSAITGQAAQLAGFVTGGTIVAALGASQALALNAASFAISAVLLQLGVGERPVPSGDGSAGRPSWWGSLSAGARLVWNDRRLRYLTALICVPGFYITVEGLAAPYAASVGGGPVAVGILFAANPARPSGRDLAVVSPGPVAAPGMDGTARGRVLRTADRLRRPARLVDDGGVVGTVGAVRVVPGHCSGHVRAGHS
ncbi:MFS transporter [Kribbella qitaiheensis]|uniref:MFS transporter n=1 Tax=Kribbella qitaiheensis TaxID=1544730 RepID=UPI001FE9BFBF|nr:MFS transporter [Kribbella qitaiheensis]